MGYVEMNRGRGRRLPKRCGVCGAQCTAYLCGGCGREMRELLVGTGVERMVANRVEPGLVWYANRLTEQKHRQARLGVVSGPRTAGDGFDLLADWRATVMLGRIDSGLWKWADTVRPLVRRGSLPSLGATQGHENGSAGTTTPGGFMVTSTGRQARFLAEHVHKIRLRCPDAAAMHADLLNLTRDAWSVINRPADMFCGPCPTPSLSERGGLCATMLYTVQGEGTVQCQKCRATHDVDALRDNMRKVVSDMLFTGPEIRRLMETRLADPVGKTSFHRMVNDGRLIARGYNADGDGLYTYADVCEARRKPVVVGGKTKSVV